MLRKLLLVFCLVCGCLQLGEKGIAGKPVSAKAGFDRAGEENA